MDEFMLTTEDNPYNPFSMFDEWYAYDCQKGYYTCSLLARIAKTSDGLSDSDNDLELLNSMKQIVSLFAKLNDYIETKGETSVLPKYTIVENKTV